ncbi:MAG TPA: universal stress protein [Nitriliruptorales bacterium]|nr:universal stress protein [Nitriliruptorales bacterium]
MVYRKIMVGTDGSETAARAQRAARRLAQRLGSELLVVLAQDPAHGPSDVGEDVLAQARSLAAGEGVTARSELVHGEPAEAIADLAEREGSDLIVVGSKGMGKARRLRLGAVAEQVAHHAPCDLLVVRTTDAGRSTGGEYRRIVVGTDGSPTATEATRKGFELAEMLQASVTLLYAGDDLDGRLALEETLRARPGTADVRTEVLPGDAAELLCQVAARDAMDLVVVGNRGVPGRRHLLTPIPLKVAHAAPTDVLIAKTVGRSLQDIAPGTGGIVVVGGRKVAVFRDDGGALHAVSPRCTHLGCTVGWNDVERTWDCPCHGSRYAADGRVMHGPAQHDLAAVELTT